MGNSAHPAMAYLEHNAPPSSHAIADALEREPGAWPRVLRLTLWRSAVLSPGLFLAGIRGWRLAGGAVLGSGAITAGLFVYYGRRRAREQRAAALRR